MARTVQTAQRLLAVQPSPQQSTPQVIAKSTAADRQRRASSAPAIVPTERARAKATALWHSRTEPVPDRVPAASASSSTPPPSSTSSSTASVSSGSTRRACRICYAQYCSLGAYCWRCPYECNFSDSLSFSECCEARRILREDQWSYYCEAVGSPRGSDCSTVTLLSDRSAAYTPRA